MNSLSWREGIVFAFAGKLLSAEGYDNAYEKSFVEKFGSQILSPLHRIIELVSKNIKLPLAICLFTILAALIIGLAFYSIPVFVIFGKLFPGWLLRFFLFFYVELNLFAIGCRALGRFNNKTLIDLWKNGRLVAVMPGDYEIRK
ncbi:MAG: hypothetical protein WC222_01455 [Parachlamydiales bacterium]|jgi:hypothetical protein